MLNYVKFTTLNFNASNVKHAPLQNLAKNWSGIGPDGVSNKNMCIYNYIYISSAIQALYWINI